MILYAWRGMWSPIVLKRTMRGCSLKNAENNNVICATDEYLKARDEVEIHRAEGISFFLLNKSPLQLFYCFSCDKTFILKQVFIVQQVFSPFFLF